jgi:hypothetical protein
MKITFRCPPELAARLPKPYPAKRGLPAWLKQMAMSADAPDLGKELPTVKQCPPFVDAMSHGFMIPLAADLHVEDGIFEWDWGEAAVDGKVPASDLGQYPRSPIGYHDNAQLTGTPFFDAEYAAIKFLCFWTIELPPGYSLLATHPINREDLPFRSVTGLVDCDRFSLQFVHFPALWVDHGFRGVLEKGTPVAQCVPVKREAYELAFDELTGEAGEAFIAYRIEAGKDTHIYKNRYREKKP